MTANVEPIFTHVPVIGIGIISAANTDRTGTGTMTSVLTADPDGTRVTRILVQAKATTTAGIVRLWLFDGVNYRLWKEVPITAITVSATQIAFASALEYLAERALVLPSGYTLYASTEKAEPFNIIIEGGDY